MTARAVLGSRALALGVLGVAVVALSLLIWPAAPGYDAWAWLTWGREACRLELSTVDGPAWKPLPVLVTTLLAPLGHAAPEAWLVVVRLGAVAAVAAAFWAGRRLGGTAAGVVAAVAVVLTGGFVRHAAVGDSEPLVVAFALGAFLLALDGRHRSALGLGVACALLRPEAWPFLGLYGLWLWRRDRALLPLLAAALLAIPALWFVPEWLGSGELLRSTDRARVPNPGQPAEADRPALASLREAALLLLPLAVLALSARGPARLLAAAGAAWIVLVALMSEAGFSGEPRYALPGAALLAVAGGVTLAALLADRRRLTTAVAVLAALATVPAAVLRTGDLADLRPRLQHQAALAAGLDRAIAAAGGRDGVLGCGRPAVGRFRGTLLAWHLDVPKRTVRADGAAAGATFSSRLTAGSPLSPPPAGRVLARARGWTVTCAR